MGRGAVRNSKCYQKGFSLIELLIALTLTLLMGAVMLEFYITQHNRFIVQEDISDMQQNARIALEEITRNIRRAGYGLSAHPSIYVGNDTLKIYFKNGTQVDSLIYYISRINPLHPNFIKKIGSGTAQVFAENIDSLKLILSGPLVLVRIVAHEKRKDKDFTGDKYRRSVLNSSVKMRNNI